MSKILSVSKKLICEKEMMMARRDAKSRVDKRNSCIIAPPPPPRGHANRRGCEGHFYCSTANANAKHRRRERKRK